MLVNGAHCRPFSTDWNPYLGRFKVIHMMLADKVLSSDYDQLISEKNNYTSTTNGDIGPACMTYAFCEDHVTVNKAFCCSFCLTILKLN